MAFAPFMKDAMRLVPEPIKLDALEFSRLRPIS